MHLNTPILAAVALSLFSIPANCSSHIGGDPTTSSAPIFSACVVLTANGPKEAYYGASKPTAPFSQSASPQPGWQVVWLPASGHLWLGQHLPGEEFQFVLLSTGLARFQTSGGRGISVQLSRETSSRTNLPGEFLRSELERLQSSRRLPSDFPKYSLIDFRII